MSDGMSFPTPQGSPKGNSSNASDGPNVIHRSTQEGCAAEKCRLIAAGHKPHWGPVLRAANEPKENWEAVQVLQVEGTKATLQTPRGTLTVYNHNPQRLAGAAEFNRQYKILRGRPKKDPDTGDTRHQVSWVSLEPITACPEG